MDDRRDSISDEEVEEMDECPNCHCQTHVLQIMLCGFCMTCDRLAYNVVFELLNIYHNPNSYTAKQKKTAKKRYWDYIMVITQSRSSWNVRGIGKELRRYIFPFSCEDRG